MAPPRDAQTRKADTLTKLTANKVDIWVASASMNGTQPQAHLIPLSLAWIDECVVVAAPAEQQTARNIRDTGKARLALGPTRDVVLIDATLDSFVGVVDAPAEFAERYAVQAGWDPRRAGPAYAYLILRPRRIQAWREENELAGRTLMRHGAWLA